MESKDPIVQNAMKMLNAAIPPDLWQELSRTSVAYSVAGEVKKGVPLDDLIKRWGDSAVGSQIPGRSRDATIAVKVLKEMKRRGM